MWCFSLSLSTEGYFKIKVQHKTGDKNAQLVLRLCSKRVEQRCCAFYHPVIKSLQPFCCKTGSIVGVKTRNIAIHLVLLQSRKTSCTFLLPVLQQLYRSQWEALSIGYQITNQRVSIILGKQMRDPLDTDLSSRQCYLLFEKLAPLCERNQFTLTSVQQSLVGEGTCIYANVSPMTCVV